MGNIGRRVAYLYSAGFGMNVIGYDPFVSAEDFPSDVDRVEHLEDLLSQADFVTLHTPLTAETQHLIDGERLAQMKPDNILINATRGALIDQSALAIALSKDQLAGAGLDVFEDEPLQVDNPLLAIAGHKVTLTPHSAALTRGLELTDSTTCPGRTKLLRGGLKFVEPRYKIFHRRSK